MTTELKVEIIADTFSDQERYLKERLSMHLKRQAFELV